MWTNVIVKTKRKLAVSSENGVADVDDRRRQFKLLLLFVLFRKIIPVNL